MIDYRNRYGAVETNGLEAGEQEAWLDAIAEAGHQTVYWADKKLAKVTRGCACCRTPASPSGMSATATAN